jgi:multimeric flavodoxin WrbA
MKILGISGSPRRSGNTELLLDRALEGAREQGAETEKIILNELSFLPCQECGDCDETGVCPITDDMQPLYGKLEESDALIIASPIFFGSLTAQTKMFIDRCQCYWVSKYILKRPRNKVKPRSGLFLCVCSSNREDYFRDSEKLMKMFFASLDISYVGALFYPGINGKGEILSHPTALSDAFNAGRSLAGGKIG